MSTNQESQEEVYWDDEVLSLSSDSSPHMTSSSHGSDTNGPTTVNHCHHHTGTTFFIDNLVFNDSSKASSSTGIEDDSPERRQDYFGEGPSHLNTNTSATKRNAEYRYRNAISAETSPNKIFKPSYQTHTTVTAIEVDPEHGDQASSSSAGQRENVNSRGTVLKKNGTEKAKKKCSPSTLQEFTTYAETAGIRPYRKSLKPHVIMKNIETFVYKNEKKNVMSELEKFYEMMEYQSHPTSDRLQNLAEVASCRRSPVAACLLLAASVFKKMREDPHKISFEIFISFQKAYYLVRGLMGDGENAENVLNHELMSNGTHPNDIANFVVEVMGDMYDWVSPCTLSVSSNKEYALRWIIAGLHKARKYDHVIKLAHEKKGDYQGKENEAVVHINRNVGLCFGACENFVAALSVLKEARAMAQVVGSDWCESLLPCLERDIAIVERKLRRQNMPDLQVHNTDVCDITMSS